MTNDARVVLEEVFNSFQRQHNTENEELSAYREEMISHLPTGHSDETCTAPRSPFENWMKYCTNYNQGRPGGRPPPGGALPQARTEPIDTLGRAPMGSRHQETRRTT